MSSYALLSTASADPPNVNTLLKRKVIDLLHPYLDITSPLVLNLAEEETSPALTLVNKLAQLIKNHKYSNPERSTAQSLDCLTLTLACSLASFAGWQASSTSTGC